MGKRKQKEHEVIKPLEALLAAEVFGPEVLALQREEEFLPVPITVEILYRERDYQKIDELSYRFAYGSQTIHISRDDVLSFFSQMTVVIDTISDNDAGTEKRILSVLHKMAVVQKSMHSFSNALILIKSSALHAIDMQELETLMSFLVSSLDKGASVKYGIGTRDYLKDRIRLLIACNQPVNLSFRHLSMSDDSV